jgi:hypothetical protein
MAVPGGGDRDEADQERRVVAGVVLRRHQEAVDRVALGDRQLDREQRDRDGDDRVGEEGQPLRGARVGLQVILVILVAFAVRRSSPAPAYETTYHPVNVDHGPGFWR